MPINKTPEFTAVVNELVTAGAIEQKLSEPLLHLGHMFWGSIVGPAAGLEVAEKRYPCEPTDGLEKLRAYIQRLAPKDAFLEDFKVVLERLIAEPAVISRLYEAICLDAEKLSPTLRAERWQQ